MHSTSHLLFLIQNAQVHMLEDFTMRIHAKIQTETEEPFVDILIFTVKKKPITKMLLLKQAQNFNNTNWISLNLTISMRLKLITMNLFMVTVWNNIAVVLLKHIYKLKKK